MASSGVPAVPWTSRVESPLIAAARCSETQVLAVPGTPSSSSARSVVSVATATSMSRRDPTYFGVIGGPSAASPPSRYVTTAARQAGARVPELVLQRPEHRLRDGRRPRLRAERQEVLDPDRHRVGESAVQRRTGPGGQLVQREYVVERPQEQPVVRVPVRRH